MIASSQGEVEAVCCWLLTDQSGVHVEPVEIARLRPEMSAPYRWYQKESSGVSKGAKSMAGLVRRVEVPLRKPLVSV